LLGQDLNLVGGQSVDQNAEAAPKSQLNILITEQILASLLHVVHEAWAVEEGGKEPTLIEKNEDKVCYREANNQAVRIKIKPNKLITYE
jgi:hypothetical protein